MNSHRTIFALSCAGLALLSAGCRRGGPDRLPLHGTVKTAAGEQLNASITFLPADDKKRPAATASVKDGVYRFDRGNGPTAGPTNIIVRRLASREPLSRSHPTKKPGSPSRHEWKLVRNVSDDGRYVQDFTLEN